MKFRSLPIAAALILSLPGSSLADSGFFIAASVGSARLSDDFDGFDIDSSSTAYRLTAGWRFNEYLALEGGYHNFGRFDQTIDFEGSPAEVTLKADGFTLGGIGNLSLDERWSLFARFGAFFWDGDADLNNVSAATPEDTNLYLGAGARFALNEQLSLTADGSQYQLDDTSSSVLSVGIDLRF